MVVNGIVFQKLSDDASGYRGIDGLDYSDNWYLCIIPGLEDIEKYYDENIEMTYYDIGDGECIAACTDMEFIKKFAEISRRLKNEFRILLCETEVPRPVMEMPKCGKKFLGYDYAYTGGNFYSAVYHEIPSVFPQFELNENGLFATLAEMERYLSARAEFEACHPPLTLETGDFVVYKLWELDSDEFLG